MVIIWGKDMSRSKYFDKIAWAVTILILIVSILFMNGNTLGLEVMAHTMGYEKRLFDNTKVHTIDIVMDDWDELIDNATSEEYYTAAVVIDGESYKNVGIRGKGNTSLSNVASMDSNRYSFKVEFDHYDSSITYHGLDKLSLNNLIQDSTMMKDYLTYTMMGEFGVNAPLCSFVYITVNGEDWGLYIAVEGVEDSFLERNYGSNYGELYKPDSMSLGGGRGKDKDFNMDDLMKPEESVNRSDEAGQDMPVSLTDTDEVKPPEIFDENMSQISGGDNNATRKPPGGGFGGMGSSDVKLQYVDDDPDSYSNIWNNAKTDITESDQSRLIESLKKLSNGKEIESVVDVEQVIRYFVVHNYVCNGDSYTGTMVHNYYLYEENGQMAMIPWDYNLAFGTFQGGDAQNTINIPIDSPVSGGSSEDRPMWNWILSDEGYTKLYHQYFTEFLDTVDVQTVIDNAYNLIKSYVKKDPTAFYTYEEFETGVETLRQFCNLRSESITMQLANGEATSNMGYVDASSLTLSDMGSMGGGKADMYSNEGDFDSRESTNGNTPVNPDTDTHVSSELNIQETPVSTSEDSLPNGEIPERLSGGFAGQSSGETEARQSDSSGSTAPVESSNRSPDDSMQRHGGGWETNMNDAGNSTASKTGWIWLTVSALILSSGLIIAKLYRN